SFVAIYSFYTVTCTLLIWHSYLSNILIFVQNSVGSSRYPLEIQDYTPRMIHLYFIPFLLIVNVPARALVGRLDWQLAVIFVAFACGLCLFSRWFWRFALRSYTGASA